MSSFKENFDIIISELGTKLSSLGFEEDSSAAADDGKLCRKYSGEKGAVSVECENGRFCGKCE